VNLHVSSVQIPTASGHLGRFLFRRIGLVECFSVFKSITSNAVGADGISLKKKLTTASTYLSSCVAFF
jgi:hypothetical protein